MTVTDPIAHWARLAAARVGDDPEAQQRADDLIAEADRAEVEARRARQAANRHASYVRRRPSLYADASFEMLTPQQNPQGMISSWWGRGPRSLALAGPTRTGKTTAAYAITNAVHATGAWVVASPAADLSAAMKPDGDPFALDHALNCDLLLLDDLGRERVTDWWLEQVQRIVDTRRNNEKRLIVTTNTEPDRDGKYDAQGAYDVFAARYGTPVAERLIDDGGILILDGPAHRRVVSQW